MRNLFKRSETERAGQEVDEFSTYKIRIYKAIPQNMALICQNIFTGRPFVKTSGLAILMPWVKSKMVSLAINTIDYPKEKYRTLDGIELTIDLALVVSVVDPIKYEFNNNDPMQELKTRTQDLLRQYVALKNVDEMITQRHTKEQFDLNGEYVLFENQSGIKVHHPIFKTVELPQSMKDDYEKQKVQERENERLLAEAETKKKVAKLEAEARLEAAKVDAEANKILKTTANILQADEINRILTEINATDAPAEKKLEAINGYFFANKEGTNVFYGMKNQSELVDYLFAQEHSRQKEDIGVYRAPVKAKKRKKM